MRPPLSLRTARRNNPAAKKRPPDARWPSRRVQSLRRCSRKILIAFLRCSLCHHRRTGRTEVPHLYSSPSLLQISAHLRSILQVVEGKQLTCYLAGSDCTNSMESGTTLLATLRFSVDFRPMTLAISQAGVPLTAPASRCPRLRRPARPPCVRMEW